MGNRLLAIYLNDHLAGATVGLEVARRARGSNEGTSYGEFLAQLVEEISEDRESLGEIMTGLGIGRDRLKVAAAWAGEKAGRLKLNGRLTSYSPLSRLVELEMLTLGVTGKLGMWKCLAQELGEELSGHSLPALIARGESQQRRLEEQRLRAAGEAFAAGQ
jgi:hypothetical protein